MKKLDSQAMAPLYRQLYDEILSKIKTNEFLVGEKIPSEEQLMTNYGVSRVTVRSAIKQLVAENILVKKHGKGTFVAMPVYVESMSAGGSFTESGLKMQKEPSTKIVSIERKMASKAIADYLGIAEDSDVIVIERVRLLDNESAIFEIDYFRTEFAFMEEMAREKESILDVLRVHGGYIPLYFDNVIEIALADDEIAAYLKVEVEEPLVKINQVVVDENEQILYFNEQYVKSDVYKVAIRSYNK